MSNIIIFDFEVFAHDTLLGTKLISPTDTKIFQTWNLDDIRKFYALHSDDIWVGHNNSGYDNFILNVVVKGGNEEQVKMMNEKIIRLNDRPRWSDVPTYWYDLMASHICSLKTLEAFFGKNISES